MGFFFRKRLSKRLMFWKRHQPLDGMYGGRIVKHLYSNLVLIVYTGHYLETFSGIVIGPRNHKDLGQRLTAHKKDFTLLEGIQLLCNEDLGVFTNISQSDLKRALEFLNNVDHAKNFTLAK